MNRPTPLPDGTITEYYPMTSLNRITQDRRMPFVFE